MPSQNHIHTYVKFKSKPGFWRCDAHNCTHYIERERVINKNSLCTSCGAVMILTYDDLKRVRPKCLNCSDTKKARAARIALDRFKDLGTTAFNPGDNAQQEELELTDWGELPRDRYRD